MSTIRVDYPEFARNRGPGFWLRPANWFAARRSLRLDNSNEWREANERSIPPNALGSGSRTQSFQYLLPGLYPSPGLSIRVIILGDTGEGDKSQYGLLPLIRALRPDFAIINGDVAYPAGRIVDYTEGFFKPYNDLGIPIWAVPGNHEYYSKYKGREFVDVFCSRKRIDDWNGHGLRFVPQPGTYWELADSDFTNVSVIGIDTGHSGNLDATDPISSGSKQMNWLNARLNEAEDENRKVILLFHIPVLVDGKLANKPHLVRLHELIRSKQCVQVVICGHVHNFQIYRSDVFADALGDITGATVSLNAPHYFVSGAGGAFLSVPPKGNAEYKWVKAFPDRTEWERLASGSFWQRTLARVRRGIAKVKLSQSVVDRWLASVEEGALVDSDKPALTSFLFVEIRRDGATLTPVFLRDLGKLYSSDVSAVNIENTHPLPDRVKVESCLQRDLEIVL